MSSAPFFRCLRFLFASTGLVVGAIATLHATIDSQPFDYAKGTMNEQEDRPDTPRTGQVVADELKRVVPELAKYIE